MAETLAEDSAGDGGSSNLGTMGKPDPQPPSPDAQPRDDAPVQMSPDAQPPSPDAQPRDVFLQSGPDASEQSPDSIPCGQPGPSTPLAPQPEVSPPTAPPTLTVDEASHKVAAGDACDTNPIAAPSAAAAVVGEGEKVGAAAPSAAAAVVGEGEKVGCHATQV